MTPDSLLQDPDDFFTQPALSFRSQPDLGDLFHEVARGTERITLVVGAGASLDAALPTWAGLLENLGDLVKERRWKEAIARDTSDPLRKAEYVTRLAAEGRSNTPEEMIRDALYMANHRPPFGPLHDAIARLVLALPHRIQVITTNFDVLLEKAFASYDRTQPPKSYRLSEEDTQAWRTNPTGDPPPVLHVHGILQPGQTPQEPIVLSESTFLKHGLEVRKLLTEVLQETLVIFIGVSLSDPNLIGPLWDTKEERKTGSSPHGTPVVLLVADGGSDEHTGDNQLAYVIKRAQFLRDEFHVRTIFSKSYAQQIQIVADLGLASLEPDRYFDTTSPATLYYGPRFMETLDQCYQIAGCDAGEDLPVGEKASNLSDYLYKIIQDDSPTSALHPMREFLSSLRRSAEKARSLEIEELGDFDEEAFALFLWLRARADLGSEYRPHEIRLLGSSAYMHREPWSLDRKARVVSFARHAASQAMFYGRTHVTNLKAVNEWTLWRSAIAVPFTVHSMRTTGTPAQSLDNLLVGAITLNSTHFIQPKAGTNDEWDKPRSILSYLKKEDRLPEITRRLSAAMQKFFNFT